MSLRECFGCHFMATHMAAICGRNLQLFRGAEQHNISVNSSLLRPHTQEPAEKQTAASAAVACEALSVLSYLATPGGTRLHGRHYVFSLTQRSFTGIILIRCSCLGNVHVTRTPRFTERFAHLMIVALELTSVQPVPT